MRVLVTGGAGYVGSVVVETLVAAGADRVVVLDDLSKGHAAAVTKPAVLVRGDIGDAELVARTCRDHSIDALVHMAASSLVGESVTDPAKYYEANVTRSLVMLDAARSQGVDRIVFSSTAAVYGEPDASPITEDFDLRPTNPYGETKLTLERALHWYQRAYDLRYVALRYFNAAGATERNGEQHEPETHLIPIVLDVARGCRTHVTVFGDDYPTRDGTCVRDYIHVSDLADAHVRSLRAMDRPGGRAFNLGCGGGFTVSEVIAAAREITGKVITVERGPRRAGDPASLVASSDRVRSELGWSPAHENLRSMVGSAWRWLQSHPDGYPAS